jgi:hypothetical protein
MWAKDSQALSPSHPTGKGKAEFFTSMGFQRGPRKGVGNLFSPHGPPLFSLDGVLDGLPLRMFIELTDAPSKLARYLFRDGG